MSCECVAVEPKRAEPEGGGVHVTLLSRFKDAGIGQAKRFLVGRNRITFIVTVFPLDQMGVPGSELCRSRGADRLSEDEVRLHVLLDVRKNEMKLCKHKSPLCRKRRNNVETLTARTIT